MNRKERHPQEDHLQHALFKTAEEIISLEKEIEGYN